MNNKNTGINIGNDNNGNINRNNIRNSQNNINKSSKTNIYKNIKYPERMTKEEKEELMKETQRPALKDKCGKRITCFGLAVRKYPYEDFYTVINVVDKNGNYIADHIQLNYREDLYNYDGQIPLKDNYIRFTGIVDKYGRSDNSEDYCINITDRVYMTSSDLFYDGEIIDYERVEINYNEISEYIKRANMTKLYNLIDSLRKEINEITDDMLCEDYIFYYIINQYFLNQATYNMYDGIFRDQGFNEECVIDILILLGHVLFDLKDREKTYLYNLFELISYSCNIIQGIDIFNKYNSNPKFINFCTNNLGCTGKRKLKTLWYIITLRKIDFNMDDPKHPKLTKDMMTYRAYHMINNYI